jgi:hypothetical protein
MIFWIEYSGLVVEHRAEEFSDLLPGVRSTTECFTKSSLGWLTREFSQLKAALPYPYVAELRVLSSSSMFLVSEKHAICRNRASYG